MLRVCAGKPADKRSGPVPSGEVAQEITITGIRTNKTNDLYFIGLVYSLFGNLQRNTSIGNSRLFTGA
jgi:hypothetical protein